MFVSYHYTINQHHGIEKGWQKGISEILSNNRKTLPDLARWDVKHKIQECELFVYRNYSE